jgi:predicted metalloprotease with PDZ domain
MYDHPAQPIPPGQIGRRQRTEGAAPFSAAIDLHVDATDVRRGIFRIKETVRAFHAGSLTLLFPEWLPGYHAPEAPLDALAGLVFTGEGRTLAWRRDPVHVHAFHVEMPENLRELQIDFQLLSPTAEDQGRVGVTLRQLNLQWNSVLLYPAGYNSEQIGVSARITLPDGWQFASALKVGERLGSTTGFVQTALHELVDSPLFAGKHHQRCQIEQDVALHLFGDSPSQIEVGAEARTQIGNLVAEADKLLGARPFDHYDFLISISDELGDLGVEHRRSAELVLPPDFFTRWNGTRSRNDVLAHEYIHAWNGKFRRGEGACTASFDQPIRNGLLWVYEGLTQYWSQVLAVRSGLWDAQTFRDALALIAARCCNMKGRRWRPLLDTTRDPIITARKKLPWESWQRNQDYYTDGQLLWLEVDILLREESGGKHALDDFGPLFFGLGADDIPTLPYGFEDVVEALGGIVPWSWKEFFDRRLTACEPARPLDAIAGSGYALVYLDQPSGFHGQTDEPAGLTDLTFSVGFSVSSGGKVKEVIWDSPAFHAGLTAGAEIMAVNGKVFSPEDLKLAVGKAAETHLLTLWVQKLKHGEELQIAYGGGHRFPHLMPLEGQPALLDAILQPRR